MSRSFSQIIPANKLKQLRTYETGITQTTAAGSNLEQGNETPSMTSEASSKQICPITEKVLLELDDEIVDEDVNLLVKQFKELYPRNPLKLVAFEGTLKCASEQGVKIDDIDQLIGFLQKHSTTQIVLNLGYDIDFYKDFEDSDEEDYTDYEPPEGVKVHFCGKLGGQKIYPKHNSEVHSIVGWSYGIRSVEKHCFDKFPRCIQRLQKSFFQEQPAHMTQLLADTFENFPRQSLLSFDNIWEYQNTNLQFFEKAENLILDSTTYCGLVREGTEHGDPDYIPHGFGRFCSSVYGWIYEGQIDNGNITGFGREFYGNGDVFIGYFEEGTRTSRGKFFSADGQLIKEGDS